MADSIRNQLAANPRLRIGLALILCIIGVYLVLDKSEQVGKLQKEYRRLSVSLEQSRQQATDTSWLSRSKAASEALVELREHDWVDNNFGLIQSKWNDNLQNLLTQEKAANATVVLSENMTDASNSAKNESNSPVAGMNIMKAKLRFEALPKTLYNILRIIDTNKQAMVVETLNYQWLGTVGRAEINIKAFTHLPDPAKQDNGVDVTQSTKPSLKGQP